MSNLAILARLISNGHNVLKSRIMADDAIKQWLCLKVLIVSTVISLLLRLTHRVFAASILTVGEKGEQIERCDVYLFTYKY